MACSSGAGLGNKRRKLNEVLTLPIKYMRSVYIPYQMQQSVAGVDIDVENYRFPDIETCLYKYLKEVLVNNSCILDLVDGNEIVERDAESVDALDKYLKFCENSNVDFFCMSVCSLYEMILQDMGIIPSFYFKTKVLLNLKEDSMLYLMLQTNVSDTSAYILDENKMVPNYCAYLTQTVEMADFLHLLSNENSVFYKTFKSISFDFNFVKEYDKIFTFEDEDRLDKILPSLVRGNHIFKAALKFIVGRCVAYCVCGFCKMLVNHKNIKTEKGENIYLVMKKQVINVMKQVIYLRYSDLGANSEFFSQMYTTFIGRKMQTLSIKSFFMFCLCMRLGLIGFKVFLKDDVKESVTNLLRGVRANYKFKIDFSEKAYAASSSWADFVDKLDGEIDHELVITKDLHNKVAPLIDDMRRRMVTFTLPWLIQIIKLFMHRKWLVRTLGEQENVSGE